MNYSMASTKPTGTHMHFFSRFKQFHVISVMAIALISTAANAGEPPTDPILRIDPSEHTAMIRHIATDSQGRWLATASIDKTVRLWSLTDGRLISTLRPPIGSNQEGMVYAVAISPDGVIVAVSGWAQFNQGKDTKSDEGNSIYLFERSSGRLLRRLTGQPNAIFDLAFSSDGRWLAATLGGDNGGVRIFDAGSGKLLAEDLAYGDQSYSVHFSNDGRLLTTSWDGLLRLYQFDGNRLALRAKRAAPGGKKPNAARFSPDGKSIAVGFDDANTVNVLEGDTLAFRFSPNSDDVDANLQGVAWSRDNATLYAAGQARRGERNYIRRWANGGKGTASNWTVASDIILDLAALPGGRLAFGSNDPSWGVVNADGQKIILHAPVGADFRRGKGEFKLSHDGSQVRFGYDKAGLSPVVFDSLNRTFLPADTPNLTSPLLSANGMTITGWDSTTAPRLNGALSRIDRNEVSRSLAIRADSEGFVLGTEWNLRAYVRGGALRWRQSAPGIAWGVNVSADGRWVVAAYSDGTIRWHRASDGAEQLAFFPHADKKRWIMWTPEGYYDASPSGEDLIGWHLNQGKDKEARFISSSQLYDVFYRPDIVQAKIRGEDISGLITVTAAEALRNPPPQLTFTKVPSTSRSNKEKICYKATSTGGGIGEVRLFQNAKLIKSDGFYRETIAKTNDTKMNLASLDGATTQRALRGLKVTQNAPSPITSNNKGNEFEECQELETLPGENEISVAAFNSPNTIQSKLETVSFNVDRKPEEAHLYVLGVGIDHYKDPSATLQYAVKDANDFRAMMQKKAGGLYKPQNIHIEGMSNSAATKDGIEKAIKTISAKIKPWDSFILFVASHGVLLDNQYYIVTASFNGSVNPANLISSNEIVGMSKNIKSLSQLFVFDTCHAGGVDNIISGLYDARMSVMAKKMGLHIYASAGSKQTAMDGYLGNGLFTHTLLKSMKDAKSTDSNQDNQVSVVELGEQARQETMDISKKLGHPQSPNIINFGRDNALFRVQ